ncbi:MAG: agmatinase family protein [Alistipes sp.]|jgi:agmatinase|nr:agmatinase family protein [Alistipes sp.]
MTAYNNPPHNENRFDPNGVGIHNGNYFGMPFSPDEAALVLVSVPWDVTSSYGAGASAAPDAIIEESTQLDFHDPWAPGEWRRGIATLSIDYSIHERSEPLREDATRIIAALEGGHDPHDNFLLARKLEKINAAGAELDARIDAVAEEWLAKGKIVGLVGGDHSTPAGLIAAVARHECSVGVLHLDAHCDLRPAYEGFECSHASVMWNALRDVPEIERLVQVGVRDFSEAEATFAAGHPKITQFTGDGLAEGRFRGETWAAQCERIVAVLPEKVYVSFDIDFLEPGLCPGTGTPVPGGASFDEAAWLLRTVVDSGRTIVGFDLCEVAPRLDGGTFDASVGARMLFKLCGQALRGATTARDKKQ